MVNACREGLENCAHRILTARKLIATIASSALPAAKEYFAHLILIWIAKSLVAIVAASALLMALEILVLLMSNAILGLIVMMPASVLWTVQDFLVSMT